MRRTALSLVLVLALLIVPGLFSAGGTRHRTAVLTDIGYGDPDDVQSFIRLLLYGNDMELEGLIATASKDGVNPGKMTQLIDAYAKVRPNLLRHASGYPAAEHLKSLMRTGVAARGLGSVGEGKSTEASRHIISVVDKPDPRPVWIQVWGAPTDLAQALWDVRNARSPEETGEFVSKLRVYDIAGQDETGAWICHHFPEIYWLRSVAQFQAISVRANKPFPTEVTGANIATFTAEWVEKNIRSHGPLGAEYIERIYKYEGDTPAFLYLLPNGLSDPEKMDQGNWGGRFNSYRTRNADSFQKRWAELQIPLRPYSMYTEAADTWSYKSHVYENSVHAAHFRWREAFQNDFAARMDWTITESPGGANHNPIAAFEGKTGSEVLYRTVRSGTNVVLDADGSSDPDGDSLNYRWFHYPEPGSYGGTITIMKENDRKTGFTAPEVNEAKTIHVILEVSDTGTPPLFNYRRIVFTVNP